MDTATGIPRERAELTVHPDGSIDVVIGTVSNGQGHETSFAQLHQRMARRADRQAVRLITGDTDIVKVGGGAHSGRAHAAGSIVIAKAVRPDRRKGKRIAARLLEAAAADIEFSEGSFTGEGHRRARSSLFEVAAAAAERADLPAELRGALTGTCDETVSDAAFPYGCHVCEVEVDPDTGVVEIVRYTAVDDGGRAVNPMIVHGQTHGGIAQGSGRRCWSTATTIAGSGQLLPARSWTMRCRAPTCCRRSRPRSARCPRPPIRSGCGRRARAARRRRSGSWSMRSSMRLAEFGVEHIEMPATSERVWRAIHGKPSRSQ